MIYMNEETYHWLRDEYSGICLSCFTVKHGDTEPDAENYQCDNDMCGRKKVQGIENLLVIGVIQIEEKHTKPYVILKNRSDNTLRKKDLIL